MAIPLEETLGDPYLALLSTAYRHQEAAAVRILDRRDGSATIRQLVGDAIARAGRYADAAVRETPPAQPLACAKGCSHCCWATVGVVAPDAIYVAEWMRAQLPDPEMEALLERAARRARRLGRMNRGERLSARLPCALLRNGCCSAYESRPLVCRWACSPSLQDCLDLLVHGTKKGLEMEGVRYQPTQEVWRGMRAGLLAVGLDASLLSLNCALAIALADPDAAERYLAGEPIFEAARIG